MLKYLHLRITEYMLNGRVQRYLFKTGINILVCTILNLYSSDTFTNKKYI